MKVFNKLGQKASRKIQDTSGNPTAKSFLRYKRNLIELEAKRKTAIRYSTFFTTRM